MSDLKNLAKELLSDVRNYLDITWTDPEGDKKLIGIISRGMEYLQRFTSRPLTFLGETSERALLFDYCRYVRAGALDEFAKNYATELLTFRNDEAVREMVSNEELLHPTA